MSELNRSGQNLNTSAQILALHAELQGNQEITSLNLSDNHIGSIEAIAALGAALRGTKVTSLNLALNNIASREQIDALGAALRGTNVTSLNLSDNDISSTGAIAALGAALRGTNVTSLNLESNNINSPERIAALRELLRQNPQITSLDLSHTGLPRGELLSLVREFRHLHHVGIDGELPVIAEELGFNRASNINAPAAAAAGQGLQGIANENAQAAAAAAAPVMELPEFEGSNRSQFAAAGQVSTRFAGSIIASRNAQAAAAASVPVMELPVIAEELGLNRASNINPPAAAAAAGQVSQVVVGLHTQSVVAARSAIENAPAAAANNR